MNWFILFFCMTLVPLKGGESICLSLDKFDDFLNQNQSESGYKLIIEYDHFYEQPGAEDKCPEIRNKAALKLANILEKKIRENFLPTHKELESYFFAWLENPSKATSPLDIISSFERYVERLRSLENDFAVNNLPSEIENQTNSLKSRCVSAYAPLIKELISQKKPLEQIHQADNFFIPQPSEYQIGWSNKHLSEINDFLKLHPLQESNSSQQINFPQSNYPSEAPLAEQQTLPADSSAQQQESDQSTESKVTSASEPKKQEEIDIQDLQLSKGLAGAAFLEKLARTIEEDLEKFTPNKNIPLLFQVPPMKKTCSMLESLKEVLSKNYKKKSFLHTFLLQTGGLSTASWYFERRIAHRIKLFYKSVDEQISKALEKYKAAENFVKTYDQSSLGKAAFLYFHLRGSEKHSSSNATRLLEIAEQMGTGIFSTSLAATIGLPALLVTPTVSFALYQTGVLTLQTTEEKYKNSLPQELLIDNFYCDNLITERTEKEKELAYENTLEVAFGLDTLPKNLSDILTDEAGNIGKVIAQENKTLSDIPARSIFAFLMRKIANEREAFIKATREIVKTIEEQKTFSAPPTSQDIGWLEWLKRGSRELTQQATTTLFVSDKKKTIFFKWARGILLFPEKQKKGVVNFAKIIIKKFDERIQSAVLSKRKKTETP